MGIFQAIFLFLRAFLSRHASLGVELLERFSRICRFLGRPPVGLTSLGRQFKIMAVPSG